MNLIGVWNTGFSYALWIMTNLDSETALRIYRCRMKILFLKKSAGQRLSNPKRATSEGVIRACPPYSIRNGRCHSLSGD